MIDVYLRPLVKINRDACMHHRDGSKGKHMNEMTRSPETHSSLPLHVNASVNPQPQQPGGGGGAAAAEEEKPRRKKMSPAKARAVEGPNIACPNSDGGIHDTGTKIKDSTPPPSGPWRSEYLTKFASTPVENTQMCHASTQTESG